MPTIVINRRRLHRRRMPHGALLIFFNPGRHRALNFRDQRTFNSLIIGDIARLMARIKILRCPRLKVRRVTITAAIKGRGSETCASSCAATITIPPPRIRSLSPGQITSYKLIFTGYVNSRETGPLINSAISIFRRVASSRPLSDYNEILERLLRKFFSFLLLLLLLPGCQLPFNLFHDCRSLGKRNLGKEPIFCRNT